MSTPGQLVSNGGGGLPIEGGGQEAGASPPSAPSGRPAPGDRGDAYASAARPAHATPSAVDPEAWLRAIGVLADRIGDLEDAVAEAVEEIGKLRKAIGDLRDSAATKKQMKKMKKILDQLEVIEVGPEDAPAKGSGKDR